MRLLLQVDGCICKIEKENTRPVDLQSNMYTQANCHYKLVVYVGWFIMPFRNHRWYNWGCPKGGTRAIDNQKG